MESNRLTQTFMELVRVDSESKDEQKFQAFLKQKCEALGLSVYEDAAKDQDGLSAGNLICKLDATAENMPPLLFCCHSDTVKPGVGIKPQVKDGYIYSDGTTILGADDKAGIAVCLELISRLKETETKHGTIEFIFTVGEEVGLLGAKELDMSAIESKYCFVLDSYGPVGGMVVASPTIYTINATFHGKSAHAGLEPEKGISAVEMAAKAITKMPLGRIDAETTANVGTIQGGTANNVVADETKLTAEVRAISPETGEQMLDKIFASMDSAAEEMHGKVERDFSVQVKGYRLDESSYTVDLASQAVRSIGRTPKLEVIGGGSDANIFNERGIETVNLSVGYEKIHTTEEYEPIEEMDKAVQVVCSIVALHGKLKERM